jgi:hypothetical protein
MLYPLSYGGAARSRCEPVDESTTRKVTGPEAVTRMAATDPAVDRCRGSEGSSTGTAPRVCRVRRERIGPIEQGHPVGLCSPGVPGPTM